MHCVQRQVIVGLFAAVVLQLFAGCAAPDRAAGGEAPTVAQTIEQRLALPDDIRSPAIDDLTDAIDANPDNAGSYVARAKTLVDAGHPRWAVRDLNAAEAIDPQSTAVFTVRGQAYAQLDFFEAALEDYNRALTVAPQSASTLRHRAAAYVALGRHDQAMADLNRAAVLTPDSVAIVRARGDAHFQAGAYESAVADYTRAIALGGSGDAQLHLQRAKSLRRLDRLEEAEEDLQHALAIDP